MRLSRRLVRSGRDPPVAIVPPTPLSGSPSGPPGRFGDVRRFTDIGSTNVELAGLARAGAADGTVVVADHQTAGRGRRGRTWEAPPGSSLLASVLLRPPPPLATIVAGLAAADACVDAAGVLPDLKWPNDLLAPGGEAKVGGILSELVDGGVAGPGVVVGLGLNVRWSSPLPPGGADLFSLTGLTLDRDVLLEAFLRRLGELLCEPSDDALAEYGKRCVTIGRDIRIVLAGGEIRGRATDVDDDGHLLVASGGGQLHTIHAGDVIHASPY
ncbi:MAG: biotin--[acetyl-CoA-carboxylase] ligase [Acidimicrobiales bacterium]